MIVFVSAWVATGQHSAKARIRWDSQIDTNINLRQRKELLRAIFKLNFVFNVLRLLFSDHLLIFSEMKCVSLHLERMLQIKWADCEFYFRIQFELTDICLCNKDDAFAVLNIQVYLLLLRGYKNGNFNWKSAPRDKSTRIYLHDRVLANRCLCFCYPHRSGLFDILVGSHVTLTFCYFCLSNLRMRRLIFC